MKTFEDYVRFKEALVADGDKSDSVDDQEVFEIIAAIMKDAWLESPELVMKSLKVLEAEKPGKFRSRIEQIENRKKSPFGRGLDKPDFHHDISRPIADKVGDPNGDDSQGG